MKALLKFAILFVILYSCKEKTITPQEPLKSYDNNLVGTWRLDSMKSDAGIAHYNTTTSEIETYFRENDSTFSLRKGATSTTGTTIGLGFYNLVARNEIQIQVSRFDLGGWPNGQWLDLYFTHMNKANTYQVNATQLRFKTSENWNLYLTKL